MSIQTLSALIDTHGIDVHDHLDRDALVPVLTGLQFQGDLAVIPNVTASGSGYPQAVPREGVAVVRGENGSNTHLLLDGGGTSDTPVMWDPSSGGPSGLDLGVLTVPADRCAFIAHPEHAYSGIAPGVYTLRRQREQADAVRLVAD